ncbi:HAD family hydrolase [Geothermobacter hydrogeniphilus]|uniref:phosphoglycolate phosphatase n=1 Tax=Geothermobacter hydrogeniphilus TaxID=1969733 RepID=A0A1X0Y8J7_9BACT|nr:HAD-IA family hydrolase [Geothermobacter hydrogeniphilus]ORJ61530.1 hypothetical protein B5V00_05695 [Geothermobacter hydrogeniphilus]
MSAVDGVIFDCDGVLFSSHDANLAYYNLVLQQLGAAPVLPDQEERARLCHTAASPEVFRQLLGEDRVEEALSLASRVDYRQFLHLMHPEPDMVETVRLLAARLPLAIATNRGNSMPEILRHFGLEDYFQVVVTSRDVARPKPAPDMLHLAADRLATPPRRLLFVGDSSLDQQAAVAAGVRFVAYRNPAEGDWNIDCLSRLIEIVSGLGVACRSLPGVSAGI